MKAELLSLGCAGVCIIFIGISITVRSSARAEPEKRERVGRMPIGMKEFLRRPSDAPAARQRAPSAEDIARANLRRILQDLSKRPTPRRREELVERARARSEEFEEPLLEILDEATETEPILIEAVGLAAVLRVEAAAGEVAKLASMGPLGLRAAAIRAGDLLAPWLPAQLEAFLAEEGPEVLVGALDVVATRKKRPLSWILPHYGDGDLRVREAAVRATPILDEGQELERLCAFAEKAKGPPARSAAAALGRTGLAAGAERCLTKLVKHEDWMVRQAALASLGGKTAALENPEPILEILEDPKVTVNERAIGFATLELTGTVPVARLREIMPGLHPVLKLLAARCLVRAGDEAALPALVSLLETDESDDVDDEDRQCARTGAWEVLVEIAGHDHGKTAEAWARWRRDFGAMTPKRLESRPPTFW